MLRTDPTFLGLQKTRLLDPLLSFPGTNDQPGDYRASGCSACHVIYANDRSPEHSGRLREIRQPGAERNRRSDDPRRMSPAIPSSTSSREPIPSSQCMVCHMHPGTNMVATYFGYTWWDNEIDGDKMYPAKQRHPSPEGAAAGPDAQSRAALPFAEIGPMLNFSEEDRHAGVQQELEGHAVRRLPQSWMDLPRRLQTRPQRQSARCRWQRRSVRRSRQVRQGRAPERHSSRKRACTASTATSSRTLTATASSTARRATRSKSTASTATARSSSARR